MIIEENLPFKFVEYHDYYGSFIGFRKEEEGAIYFCSCMFEAIENYILMRNKKAEAKRKENPESFHTNKKYNMQSEFILSKNDFPIEIVSKLIDDKVVEDEGIIEYLKFEDKLCHKCNKAVPTKQYCHPMYGGRFVQKYGWYINMKRYELGLNENYSFDFPEKIPQEILDLVSFTYLDLIEDLNEYYYKEISNLPFFNKLLEYLETEFTQRGNEQSRMDFLYYPNSKIVLSFFMKNYCLDCKIQADGATVVECIPQINHGFKPHVYYGEQCFVYKSLLEKAISKKYRKVSNFIENEVRREVDIKDIGDTWTSEALLYSIVKRLFQDCQLIRHYRPAILDHLELDIFIKELNIGIEYQGIQHFKAVKHWGGKEGLEKTKFRDKKKKELCEQAGIKLVYFYHDENLSEEIVIKKLKEND